MIVDGWNNGSPNDRTGAGYGIRVKSEDRDKYFQRGWPSIIIELEKGNTIEVNLSNSFWRYCIELRSAKIGKWMLGCGLAPWQKGIPPKLKLEPIGNRQFRLSRIEIFSNSCYMKFRTPPLKNRIYNIMRSTKQKEANKMQVGVCGICCDTCGLKTKGICQGCVAGDSPEAAKKVKFLKSINVLCPVLDCVVKKKIAFCSRDCKEFPCQIFEGEYPYSKAFLGMYKSRMQQK